MWFQSVPLIFLSSVYIRTVTIFKPKPKPQSILVFGDTWETRACKDNAQSGVWFGPRFLSQGLVHTLLLIVWVCCFRGVVAAA